MAKYKLTATDSIVRDDGAYIPADSENTDYREYLAWISNGEIPDAADPPFIPPISVTPWQIRKALNQIGLRSTVESAVAVADQDTKDGWERAQTFVENDPLVISLCAAIGKTDADRHALFQLAETL